MQTEQTMNKETFCHHCGKQIVFNRTYPDAANSYWAHAVRVFNGKSHSLGNALMEQRCADGIHWATPRRKEPIKLSGIMVNVSPATSARFGP